MAGRSFARRRGFTITEILVALLVAMFGIIPLLNLNTMSRRKGQQGEAYALAQIEAERLVNHFSSVQGYDDLNYRVLAAGAEVELDETDAEVATVLSAGTGLDQAARLVKRRVHVRRMEAGLLHIQAIISWQSTAPVKDLNYTLDRFISNQRVSVMSHYPFQIKVGVAKCN